MDHSQVQVSRILEGSAPPRRRFLGGSECPRRYSFLASLDLSGQSLTIRNLRASTDGFEPDIPRVLLLSRILQVSEEPIEKQQPRMVLEEQAPIREVCAHAQPPVHQRPWERTESG